MKLAQQKPATKTSIRRYLPNPNINPLGLRIDAAALSWLKLQSQDKLDTFGSSARLHPLSFIKLILEQIHKHNDASTRSLFKESFFAKRVPSQHLYDHHFARSLKYISKNYELELSKRSIPKPGDIVIFSENNSYMQLHWAICGSANRLYHIDQICNRIACTCLRDGQKPLQILQLAMQM